LPAYAWEALKHSDRLYYRVGSTSSQTGWEDYMVSTSDEDAETSAPVMTIEEERVRTPPAGRDAQVALQYQS
jgi:metacaspase-1